MRLFPWRASLSKHLLPLIAAANALVTLFLLLLIAATSCSCSMLPPARPLVILWVVLCAVSLLSLILTIALSNHFFCHLILNNKNQKLTIDQPLVCQAIHFLLAEQGGAQVPQCELLEVTPHNCTLLLNTTHNTFQQDLALLAQLEQPLLKKVNELIASPTLQPHTLEIYLNIYR